MPKPSYRSEPRKTHSQILHTIINERVDVRLETIDYTTFLFSIAVGRPGHHMAEGNQGTCVAMNRAEGLRMWEALGDILGVTE